MYKDLYESWKQNSKLTDEDRKELESIANDEKEIEYRFAKNVDFGTAGMRGLIGLGVNMLNVYTVRRATQALAEYITSLGKEAKMRGVVISYDTRRKSLEFAKDAAIVLASNGIRTYLFSTVHPVPMLSFAVRELSTVAGIMITASHNPKEYNGYKVYGEDGAQMSPQATKEIVKRICAIDDALSDRIAYNPKAYKKVELIGKSFDKRYYKIVKELALSPKEAKKYGKKIKLVYTPVHGSGYVPVKTMLHKIGINPILVADQTNYDTEFSTVKVPNPEFKETLSKGIELANSKGADVVFGTDPDCDRLGVAVRNKEGEFQALSGNQVGILLLNYVLTKLKEENKLEKGFVVKSFVTTGMAKKIADDFGVQLYETPVGFKFIGERIKELDDEKIQKFIFGFEESCGYLRGTHARDKDAVVASMLFAEMVCYYASKNIGIFDVLNGIYDKYGYVYDCNECIEYSGLSAMKDMEEVVEKVRNATVKELGGHKVYAIRDYSEKIKKLPDGATEKLHVPSSNAVYFELDNSGFVCIRPSGTEPKLKIYYSIGAKDKETALKDFEEIKNAFNELLNGKSEEEKAATEKTEEQPTVKEEVKKGKPVAEKKPSPFKPAEKKQPNFAKKTQVVAPVVVVDPATVNKTGPRDISEEIVGKVERQSIFATKKQPKGVKKQPVAAAPAKASEKKKAPAPAKKAAPVVAKKPVAKAPVKKPAEVVIASAKASKTTSNKPQHIFATKKK